MLKALLVDDEVNNLESLAFLLENDCKGVKVVSKCNNAKDARAFLLANKVDVVFLDINMPGENGFQLLSSIDYQNFKIIFVTAYNEYALQAIKASALDYILKPVSIDELQLAIDKLKKSIQNNSEQSNDFQLLDHFLNNIGKMHLPQKIALPQLGGINFIEVDNIVSIQADSNYSIIHMNTMQKLVISKTLKDFEDILEGNQFVRIHKSYIVNLRYIKEYNTADGGIVKMTDGNQWSVSRRQLENFLEKMKQASLMFDK